MESTSSLPSTPETAAPRVPLLGRFSEWLLRRGALRRAHTDAEADTREQRQYRRFARIALELAERARELSVPSATPATLPARSELYRESAYWALLSLRRPGGVKPSYAELWDTTAWAELPPLAAALGADPKLRELAVGSTFADFGALSAAEQELSVRELSRLAHVLRSMLEDPEDRIEELERQRLWRIGLPLIAVAVLAVVVVPRTREWLDEQRDLARGKPWRASSEWIKCFPAEERCGEQRNLHIFFHTKEEQSPWFEIDLGKPTRFSQVDVVNRSDCCAERVIPLVVEVSSDRSKYERVARRDTLFDHWTADFSATEARYVRLRIDAKAFLHLERVRVFR